MVVEEELQDEDVVVQVEEVLEDVVEAGASPSMSAALWECDRQRALIGSNPSCRETQAQVRRQLPAGRLLVSFIQLVFF